MSSKVYEVFIVANGEAVTLSISRGHAAGRDHTSLWLPGPAQAVDVSGDIPLTIRVDHLENVTKLTVIRET